MIPLDDQLQYNKKLVQYSYNVTSYQEMQEGIRRNEQTGKKKYIINSQNS